MSKDFIIIFFGLIAHFGLPNGDATVERAVLTRFANHTPVLFLRVADIQAPMPKPFPLTPLACPGGSIAGVACYDLTKVHLEIRGLPAGPLGSVDPHVPRLTKITDGKNPRAAVKKAAFKHAFAYVDYTGGCLKAPKLNDPEIYWASPQPPVTNCHPSGQGGGPYCVPRYTIHDSTPTGTAVVLYVVEGPAVKPGTPAPMRQITLQPNSKIAVVNLSPPMTGSSHPSDYKEHLRLNDGHCILDMQRNGTTPCAKKADTLSCDRSFDLADLRFTDTLTVAEFVHRYSLEVECGQTQNPPP